SGRQTSTVDVVRAPLAPSGLKRNMAQTLVDPGHFLPPGDGLQSVDNSARGFTMARNPTRTTPTHSKGIMGFNPLLALNRDITRLVDELLQPTTRSGAADQTPGAPQTLMAPQINVSETDKEIRVRAELPGVDLSDLQVDVVDDMLMIRGDKTLERSEDDENY